MDIDNLTYEQTIELEENIKLKNRADLLYKKFLRNVKLDVSKYRGDGKDGKFVYWEDQHNSTYFRISGGVFYFVCAFLHENYTLQVTPSAIFKALKNKDRVIDHFESLVADKNT